MEKHVESKLLASDYMYTGYEFNTLVDYIMF
jgi:hypothetical protein